MTLAEVSRKCTGVPAGIDQLVHAGDALVRIDEQPFPIERDDLDCRAAAAPARIGVRRIEIMGADPGDAAEEQDDQRRDGPDDEFDPAGVRPVREPLRACGCLRGTTRRRRKSRKMTGTTTASMIAVASARISRSAPPTGPRGSSTP